MELMKRKFTVDFDDGNDNWISGQIVLCFHTMRALFVIPEKIEMIWLSLHDRPAANRYEAKVVLSGYFNDGDYPEICLEDSTAFSGEETDKILEPLLGKTVYLDCEYLE